MCVNIPQSRSPKYSVGDRFHRVLVVLIVSSQNGIREKALEGPRPSNISVANRLNSGSVSLSSSVAVQVDRARHLFHSIFQMFNLPKMDALVYFLLLPFFSSGPSPLTSETTNAPS